MYEHGRGVAKDLGQAFEWYRRSAEHGNATAQCNLGRMYEHGQGVAKDLGQAFEWCRRSAEQRNAWAQFLLALKYGRGEGVEKDLVKALMWGRRSAEQGVANAQYHLGNVYKTGWGVEKDVVEAIKWYRLSAEQGFPPAQWILGRRYETGDGVAKDVLQAIGWYRRSAEQGYTRAQLALGVKYKNGRGVQKDWKAARRWLLAANHSADAQSERGRKDAAIARHLLKPLNAAALAEALQGLEGMIGLENVKAQIRRLTDFVEMQCKRKAAGLKSAEVTLHLVFTGNPGTGKTTVARYVGEIYAALGLLERGHVVAANREDLVAGWIGQTALKTKAKIQEALNGVLFIDEAYSLHVEGPGHRDFGAEAVATLVAEMENNRDRLAVIVAGYPAEMKGFINMNPGLSSRFTRYIEFEDYNPRELTQIFVKFAESNDYKLDEKARSAVLTHLTVEYAKRGRDFGNGRYVRKKFEEAVEMHAARVKKSGARDRDSLALLTEADLRF
jgi:TPR repeat protein/AAA+ superfamily predicted ATPase